MQQSSAPPEYVKLRIPHSVIWICLGQLVLGALAIAATWLHMHDQVLRLELQVAGYESKIDQLTNRISTYEAQRDNLDTRIRVIEQGHR